MQVIRLARGTYEGVRADPDRFLVLRGHEFHWSERTVEKHAGWLVVAKIGAGPAIAEALDPGSS